MERIEFLKLGFNVHTQYIELKGLLWSTPFLTNVVQPHPEHITIVLSQNLHCDVIVSTLARHQTDSQIVFKRQFWAKDIFMKTRQHWVFTPIVDLITCLDYRSSNLPFRDWHLLCFIPLSSCFYPAFKSYTMVLVSFIQW